MGLWVCVYRLAEVSKMSSAKTVQHTAQAHGGGGEGLIVLKQGEEVVVAVGGQVGRVQVRQELVWVGQLGEQLWR